MSGFKPKRCVSINARTDDGREMQFELCIGDDFPIDKSDNEDGC